ncbi:hypothetical protein RFI_03544 [Reticulomyxa filosa]|uniref:Protein kinase domain-containing protein n=1 Tax=Reticulomyxa filosa TaxID=46433 RepID=X6P643_RETFI|nr:hypothetical protein RFI_03544 [Reticulomyxa filosa]|eukprot:ETO33559.1 hypothetical protein RFI_03544 [Reticulomyxa filosa]
MDQLENVFNKNKKNNDNHTTMDTPLPIRKLSMLHTTCSKNNNNNNNNNDDLTSYTMFFMKPKKLSNRRENELNESPTNTLLLKDDINESRYAINIINDIDQIIINPSSIHHLTFDEKKQTQQIIIEKYQQQLDESSILSSIDIKKLIQDKNNTIIYLQKDKDIMIQKYLLNNFTDNNNNSNNSLFTFLVFDYNTTMNLILLIDYHSSQLLWEYHIQQNIIENSWFCFPKQIFMFQQNNMICALMSDQYQYQYSIHHVINTFQTYDQLLPESLALLFACQIFEIILHLHLCQIIHTNIQCQSFLWDINQQEDLKLN